ncbi:Serine/threonine-protein phosphatase Pgam5 [Phytophthora cinnamomi]|uniref:Serine/threonine-protein phosphatase Pgam5 n=1 Tax=Phytophthora cinnamomi TaxID=4785 RepID=UPI00355AA07A|nr:Serine/threonine-protein phosphatase Pgam5 [Phytophthora cinnamomi]
MPVPVAAVAPYSVLAGDNQQPTKPAKSPKTVHFASTKELETCRPHLDSHYPTPPMARAVPQNGSTTRRYTIDEVELYFSEDRPECPVGFRDYAVQKAARRESFVLCGFMETRRVKMGLTSWTKCWAELYHGILVLRKFKDTIQRKRSLVPVASGRLEFLDFKQNVMQIDYLYQGRSETSVLRFQSKQDMFLWWWSIQVAARVPMEPQLLHKCMGRATLSPFQIKEGTYQVDNVLFPKSIQPVLNPLKKKQHPQGVTHLLFIRHGETENINFRVCDRDKRLTKRGEEQAAITAKHLSKVFKGRSNGRPSVTLVYGGLRRTVETAAVFAKAMPWIANKHECCFLEDGAPKNVDSFQRFDYRESMHKMAFQNLCRWDGDDNLVRGPKGNLENFKLVIAHTSFIQYCLAQCYDVPKEIIQLGAPISHCSLTRIDVTPNDEMTGKFSNRVSHLPLTHQTSE